MGTNSLRCFKPSGSSPRRSLSSLTLDSTETTWSIPSTPLSAHGTRDGLLTRPPRRRSPDTPLLMPSTTTSFPPSVFPMPLFVFLFPTSTTLRELVKLFAELSNKELFDLVTKSDSSLATLRERRFSPSNSTRRSLSPLDPVTPSVFRSRVLPRTRRSPLVIIYNEKDGELKPIKSFTALVAVQEHPGVLKPGYCPVVFSRTAKVACKMTKILWKMGKKTGGAKVENPPELSQFENAEIEFEPTAPLFVEPFAKCAALGRFAVMDSNRLKMLGKVSDVVHGE